MSHAAFEPAPDRDLVIYDGECAFCRRSIASIQRRDRDGRFQYVPRSTPGLEQRYPALLEGDFNTGMRLIDQAGIIHVGSDAIHRIAGQLPFYRRLAWLYRMPVLGFITRRAYTWVAANRMRLSRYCDDDGGCRVDTPPRDTRSDV